MVRARKSHGSDEENTTKLKPAVIHKAGANRYVVYCSYPRDEQPSRLLVWSYNEIYAVNWMIRMILGPTGAWEKRDDIGNRTAVVTDKGVVISMYGDILHAALEYEPNSAELEWKDDFVYRAIMQLKYGSNQLDRHTDGTPSLSDRPAQGGSDTGDSRVAGDGRDTGEAERSRGTRGKRGTRRDRKRDDKDDAGGDRLQSDRTKSPRTPRPKPEGLVTAGDIATRLKTEARLVRGALRSLGLEKPEHGWAWEAKEAKSVEVQIVAQLKKDKKL